MELFTQRERRNIEVSQFDIGVSRECSNIIPRVQKRGIVEDDELFIRRDARECIDQVVCVTPDAGEMILDITPVNGVLHLGSPQFR